MIASMCSLNSGGIETSRVLPTCFSNVSRSEGCIVKPRTNVTFRHPAEFAPRAAAASVMEANASRYHGMAPEELDWTDAQRKPSLSFIAVGGRRRKNQPLGNGRLLHECLLRLPAVAQGADIEALLRAMYRPYLRGFWRAG